MSATPGSAMAPDRAALREAMQLRNEEIALLRSVNEELREKNEEIAGRLNVVEEMVDQVAPPQLDAPSDTVRRSVLSLTDIRSLFGRDSISFNTHQVSFNT